MEKQQGNIMEYNGIQYNTIQYNTIQCRTIQYNNIQYNTTLLVLCLRPFLIQLRRLRPRPNASPISRTSLFLPPFLQQESDGSQRHQCCSQRAINSSISSSDMVISAFISNRGVKTMADDPLTSQNDPANHQSASDTSPRLRRTISAKESWR